MLVAGAVAVILHNPAPLVVPVAGLLAFVRAQGPPAGTEKLTVCPEVELAITLKLLPYCTGANAPKLMVCDWRFEP